MTKALTLRQLLDKLLQLKADGANLDMEATLRITDDKPDSETEGEVWLGGLTDASVESHYTEGLILDGATDIEPEADDE